MGLLSKRASCPSLICFCLGHMILDYSAIMALPEHSLDVFKIEMLRPFICDSYSFETTRGKKCVESISEKSGED